VTNYVDLHLSRGDLVVIPIENIRWGDFIEFTRMRSNGVRFRNYYGIEDINEMQGPVCFSFFGLNLITVRTSKGAPRWGREYHLPYCAPDGSFRDERTGGITNIYRS